MNERPNIAELPEWFRQTSAGRKIVQDRENQVANERRELIQSLESEREKIANDLTPLKAAVETAKRGVQQAELALADARRRLVEAQRARARRTYQYDQRRLRIASELKATAPSCINAWEKELMQLEEDLQGGPEERFEDAGVINGFFKRRHRVFSDAPSRRKRGEAIRRLK